MTYPPPPSESDPTAQMPPVPPGQPPYAPGQPPYAPGQPPAAPYAPGQPPEAPYAPGQASIPTNYTPGEPAYVADQPPYMPGQAPYVAGQPYPPAPQKSKAKPFIIIGSIAAALLVLCCGGGAIAFVALRDNIPTTLPTTAPAEPPSTRDDPTEDPPSDPRLDPTTPPPEEPVESEEGETFNMAVGDTVRITDEGTEWRVTITGMQWRADSCGGLVPPEGRLLVADVTFEVIEGEASINPLYFEWVGSDGTTADTFSALFTGCADPSLDSGNSLGAGTERSGQIAFDVTGSTTGVIKYEELLGGEIASWVAPAP